MRTWRNHAEVRRVSLTQHEIGADEHARWWQNTRTDPTRRVLIYERADAEGTMVPSGVVTFFDIDEQAGTGWWGYYLDNAGLEASGALSLAWISIQREAVKYARDVLGLRELHGETLSANEAAVAFNERQKFELVETTTRELPDGPVEVLHTRRIFA